jgi:hypothetical protein
MANECDANLAINGQREMAFAHNDPWGLRSGWS